MKTFSFVFCFLLFIQSFGQDNLTPKITAKVLEKIKTDVEKEVAAYRQSLSKKDWAPELIEFSVDTFRIERIVDKRMDSDFTTTGMNSTVNEKTKAYDKLMNKYYNKLLQILTPGDKAALITAQKAWMQFRDAELKLIRTMMKEEYSGGGTIQSNIAAGDYSDMIVNRTVTIFNYFGDSVLKD